MPTAKIDYGQLLKDFLIGDRRLGDRLDLIVDLKFQSPEEMMEQLPTLIDKIPGVGRGHVSIMKLPGGVARMSIVSAAPLLKQEEEMFFLLGRLVQHCENEARGKKSCDPVIGRSLKELRDSLGTPLAAVARQIQTSQAVLSKWESGVRMPRTCVLYAWCQALGLVCPPKTALVRIVDFSPELLRFLQEDPARLCKLTPEQFERFVAERMDRMGYNVTLTGASNRKDGGIDLIAMPRQANLAEETVARIADLRFGLKRVAYDPSDPESNKLAVSKGYTVVYGSQMSKPEWDAVKRANAILPAGQVTPSPKPFSPDGKPLNVVPREKWTAGMKAVAAYVQRIAPKLIGAPVFVEIANDVTWPFRAAYGKGVLILNAGRLGHGWFSEKLDNIVEINQLIIHELGHHYSGDHLSSDYHDGLCVLGAKLTQLRRYRTPHYSKSGRRLFRRSLMCDLMSEFPLYTINSSSP